MKKIESGDLNESLITKRHRNLEQASSHLQMAFSLKIANYQNSINLETSNHPGRGGASGIEVAGRTFRTQMECGTEPRDRDGAEQGRRRNGEVI